MVDGTTALTGYVAGSVALTGIGATADALLGSTIDAELYPPAAGADVATGAVSTGAVSTADDSVVVSTTDVVNASVAVVVSTTAEVDTGAWIWPENKVSQAATDHCEICGYLPSLICDTTATDEL